MNKYEYPNKFFDKKLDGLLSNLTDCFGLTTKGNFILLANYGLMKNFNDNKKSYKSNGKSFRSNTDNELNNTIYILVAKLLKENNELKDLGRVLDEKETFEDHIDQLLQIANNAGDYLLENELSSYKNTIVSSDKNDFISDVYETLLLPIEEYQIF